MVSHQTGTETPGNGRDATLQDDRVLLGLLNAVDADEAVTQRTLASELGIALGLVNAYLKRCVKKGLIKVQDAPARRYAYYLTPNGFSEKSRLTVEYLSHSFSFLRRARRSSSDALAEAAGRGWSRAALIGAGELAEVAALCSLEAPITIVSVYDPQERGTEQVGLKAQTDIVRLANECDGAILTALNDPAAMYETAVTAFTSERVIVPDLLAFAVAPRKRAEELESNEPDAA